MSASPLISSDTPAQAQPWPAFPTETDIYLLPDGRVIIADLPVELTDLAAALGTAEPCALTPTAAPSQSASLSPSPALPAPSQEQ